MKTKLLYLALLLSWARFGVAETFSSIFSIHTERARYCPESYEPDEDYIACCWWQATLTSARGPDKSMSPACCDKTATCSGPAPVMFDWTTNEYGFMVTITPPDKTSKVPQTNEPDITTTDFETEDDDSPWYTMTPTSRAAGSTNESTDSSDSSSSSGLGGGAIAGIVVSCVCSVLGLIFGIWFRFYKLRRREKKETEQAQMFQQQQQQQSWAHPTYPTSPVPPVSGPIQWPQAPPPTRLTGGWVR